MRTISSSSIIIFTITLFILEFSGLDCTTPIGGGSEAGNAKIVGRVVDSLGNPVADVIVTARPHNYDPVKDILSRETDVDRTDSDGQYHFSVSKKGYYTVDAQYSKDGKRAFISNLEIMQDDNSAPQCTLKTAGTIQIQLPQIIDRTRDYVYIPGTAFFTFLNKSSEFAVLNNVPVARIPSVSIASLQKEDEIIIRHDITVEAGDTSTIYNPSWKYSRRFRLNTTSNGAAVSDTVYNFPVCIRLTSENFTFEQAESDGSDLRFTKQDNTYLPYEIERWDPHNSVAEIWVEIDTVFGNDSTHYYSMYWGNTGAQSESHGATVFDTSTGFQGVWHLSSNNSSQIYDATSNQYHGIPYNLDMSSVIDGVIGEALYFNGFSSYISIPNTSDGNLNLPQNGHYSISLWTYADTIDTLWHVIAGKGHEQYYLKFKCFNNGKATWEFVEFKDQQGWELTEDTIPPAPGAGQWVYLTGVRDGTHQYLYINGVLVDDSIGLQSGTISRNTGDNFTIGKYARQVTTPTNEGWCHFRGKVDEVRVMNRALSSSFIKLSYMNQKPDDSLVEFR